MAQSLFNFNTLNLTLSAPPVLSTMVIYLSSYIQGTTKVQLNYNNLFAFKTGAYKTKLVWDASQPSNTTTIINSVYKYDSVLDPLSTFSPLNSALSYYVYVPQQTSPQVTNSIYTIYFQNGTVLTYQNSIFLSSDNVIDLNLNVLDVQNTYYPGANVYNIVSQKGGVVFNSTDIGYPPAQEVFIPSPTPTPTITVTPSLTPAITPTLTPNATVTPTVTPTPSRSH